MNTGVSTHASDHGKGKEGRTLRDAGARQTLVDGIRVGFRYSAARRSRRQSTAWPSSGSPVEALVGVFDRADVVAAVAEHPSEGMVEVVDVAAAQSALVLDDPAELERHL